MYYRQFWKFIFLVVSLLVIQSADLWSKSARFRCMWRSDPATTMVIGWDQVSGIEPIVYYGQKNLGANASAYKFSRKPDRIVRSKGMNNHFVRLSGLKPGAIYYFIVKDNEGSSQTFSFRTAPITPNERISIIAGGDSRNNRDARLNANRLVSKLRPHCVVFAGDMTNDDGAKEWREWFDDWQQTFGAVGRIFPIIAARGNHEQNNAVITDLFDTPSPKNYYSLTLGGNLLRIFTLNSSEPAGGEQRSWLEKEFQRSADIRWRFAQYHHSMRPHNRKKEERQEQFINWAPLFNYYKVQLVLESDAHVVKCTYPIRPYKGAGSEEGFIRDDQNGTVYIGEGCWGSPLRTMDDQKTWTRHSGMFNQFKWLFIDRQKIEIRTVVIDASEQTQALTDQNNFTVPRGLTIWSPGGEDVVRIYNREQLLAQKKPPPPQKPLGPPEWAQFPLLPFENGTQRGELSYQLHQAGEVSLFIINPKLEEIDRFSLKKQAAGFYKRPLNLSHLPAGHYLLVLMAGGKPIGRYRLIKSN